MHAYFQSFQVIEIRAVLITIFCTELSTCILNIAMFLEYFVSQSAQFLRTKSHVYCINSKLDSRHISIHFESAPGLKFIKWTVEGALSSGTYSITIWASGEQLVQALHHKNGSSGFDSWQCPWKFSCDIFLLSSLSVGVHSASNRNEHHWGKVRSAPRADNSAVLVCRMSK